MGTFTFLSGEGNRVVYATHPTILDISDEDWQRMAAQGKSLEEVFAQQGFQIEEPQVLTFPAPVPVQSQESLLKELSNLTPKQFAECKLPGKGIYSAWIQFLSPAGQVYVAVHVLRRGVPYVLLTSKGNDYRDFRRVAGQLEGMLGKWFSREEPGVAPTHHAEDIRLLIRMSPISLLARYFSKRYIALKLQTFYVRKFLGVSVLHVYCC